MFRLADDLRVYLHRDPIDFRAGINSPAIVVEQSMGLSPFERAVFVFCNRRRTRMKLLFFERSGFVLFLKALSEDRFRWPRREAPVVTLDTEQLRDNSKNDGLARGLTAKNFERIWGTNQDDDIRGSDVSEWLSDGSKDDILQGRGGDDALIGGSGKDTQLPHRRRR